MKLVTCKRCSTPDLRWYQNGLGKWYLVETNLNRHVCDDSKLKPVKCKYCSANDLHWAEELMPDGNKKAVLTESYGLPHACDEQIAFMNKQKQDKKDKYEAEKKRINGMPDGKCATCNGNGGYIKLCESCHGWGHFDPIVKRRILAQVRTSIWPNMKNANSRW